MTADRFVKFQPLPCGRGSLDCWISSARMSRDRKGAVAFALRVLSLTSERFGELRGHAGEFHFAVVLRGGGDGWRNDPPVPPADRQRNATGSGGYFLEVVEG